jgi:phosphatidylserine/phosphatidylglycerophosphate/cardiolipin synthase-like enzyme
MVVYKMRVRTFFLQLLFLSLTLFSHAAENVDKSNIKLYFSPQDHLADQLISYIDKEQKSLHVAVYCFTHRGITEALVRAKKRGVEIEVIVDPFSVKARSPVVRMAGSGIPIYVWDPGFDPAKRKKAPIMHDKFCVFGGKSVWTGSFNFTYEADTVNRENALYIEDLEYAKKFLDQFRSMKNRGCSRYEEYLTAHPKPVKKK